MYEKKIFKGRLNFKLGYQNKYLLALLNGAGFPRRFQFAIMTWRVLKSYTDDVVDSEEEM